MKTTTVHLDKPRAIVKPSIHLNGSSPDHLIEELLDASSAVSNAIEAVCKASPNARDYYPLGADAWTRAETEHRDRIAALVRVRDELGELFEHVHEEREKRLARRRVP
jgi:hypothetical protein